jgi:hypothetical protein
MNYCANQFCLSKIGAAALCLFLGSFALNAAVADQSSKANGWILHQNTAFLGDQLVHISPLGIKVVCQKNGMTFLSRPPFDKFDLYNPKTRKVFRGALAHFESPIGIGEYMLNGFAFSHIPLVKDRSTTVHSLACTLYGSTPKFAAVQVARVRAKEMPSRNPKTVEYTVADQISSNPVVHALMCNWFALPQATGVPVEFAYRDTDNDQHKYLTMQSCERETVKAEDFATPGGLKVTDSAQGVNMGSVYDSEAVRMMFGDETDRNSK